METIIIFWKKKKKPSKQSSNSFTPGIYLITMNQQGLDMKLKTEKKPTKLGSLIFNLASTLFKYKKIRNKRKEKISTLLHPRCFDTAT